MKRAQGGTPPAVSKQAMQKAINLSGIYNLLNGGSGISNMMFQSLEAGNNGDNGHRVAGGANGVFGGLSPQAVHALMQSGLMQQITPQQVSTQGLTGPALAIANAQNQLYASQGPRWQLARGITQQQLGQFMQAQAALNSYRAAAGGFMPLQSLAGIGLWSQNPYAPKWGVPGAATPGSGSAISTAGAAASTTPTTPIAVPGVG